jgi:sugar lactone lactonase YvrE
LKRAVSPTTVVLLVIFAFIGVFTVYWKTLLSHPPGKPGKMMGGGGGMPPPPIVGLRNVTVTTPAGPLPQTRTASEGGYADGVGRNARFDGPSAVGVDGQGTVWVTDSRNHRIRRLAPDGTVTTVAGSGPGSATVGAFADGPGEAARLWNPSGVAIGPDGSLFIADTGNHRIRAFVAGQVRCLCGGDTPLDAFGLQAGGFQDGPGANARFRYPTGIVRRSDGALLVADTGNCKIRAVLPDGSTTTYADLSAAGAKSPCGIALAPDGRVLVTDPATKDIFVIAPDHSISRLPGIRKDDVIWGGPTGIVVSPQGVVYIADAASHCILRIRPGGSPEIIAGTVSRPVPTPRYADGLGDKAMFAAPSGIAIDGAGALYVADFGNNAIRKLVIGPEIQRRPHGKKTK